MARNHFADFTAHILTTAGTLTIDHALAAFKMAGNDVPADPAGALSGDDRLKVDGESVSLAPPPAPEEAA